MNELIFESEDIARKRVKRYREKKAQNVKNEIQENIGKRKFAD